ncbi:MAG TPA: proton-conducting transporter membrane subunit [Spirochaetia bacterium]|nr:proton-conducting transporter membrane subunit [Spirochaetia bacterium]
MTLAVGVPLIGSLLLPLAGAASARLRNGLALAFVLVPLACTIGLAPAAVAGTTTALKVSGPLGFDFILKADTLAVLMAFVSSLVGAIIVLYSFDYISHYGNQNEYYLMAVLFIGAMMGLVFSANLIFLFVFWEITGIASWRLIGFYRKPADVLRADKAFLVTTFGALVMLIAIIAIDGTFGSFDLDAMTGSALPAGLAVLLLVGILSKSATLPFHTWLPDAGVAPSPVTALLHAAVLVKIGVYVYARLFLVVFSTPEAVRTAVMVVAAASALVSAGAALVENDLKRIIAFSTVSQIGFIFLGLASGTAMGAAGALLYILAHGLAKGGLFLTAGIVEQNAGSKDIRQLGGIIRTMPVTAISFLLCAFSIMGIPPFGGFFSKFMVVSGAVGSGQIALAAVFMGGAVLTILYLSRLFLRVFTGEPRAGRLAPERSPAMVACVVTLAVLSLASGLAVGLLSGTLNSAVAQMAMVGK